MPRDKKPATPETLELLKKAKERADRIRPPKTATDYWGMVQSAEQRIKKLILAANQVEIWDSPTWPLIEGCFERTRNAIDDLLVEHDDEAERQR